MRRTGTRRCSTTAASTSSRVLPAQAAWTTSTATRPQPPIEFSIESVAANCQFTKVVRFQLVGPPPSTTNTTPSTGQQVTASTLYLNHQKLEGTRVCTLDQGPTPVHLIAGVTGG